ncbi:hypothetical protein ACFVYA_06945 [Amycolatopsis sp. NPDC058278]|uniref:hypothetical protein n=1 Tax=Amycolatopsis sp. NPDC058278 TaxID=3346417 RepID=UPI0036DDD07F
MTWLPGEAHRQVDQSQMDPVLRSRCEVLLLRMRIELVAKRLPADRSLSSRGRIDLRLWGLVTLGTADELVVLRQLVQRVQLVYRSSSQYLHSRRSGLVPPSSEIDAWRDDIAALESAVDRLLTGNHQD